MIIDIPRPRTDSLDELFQNPAVQQFLKPGMATPRPARLSSGERALVFCFRETNEFIGELRKPLVGIQFGRFVFGAVWVPKVMLLIVNPEQEKTDSLAEMDINWHDLECGRDVIDLLADGARLVVRFYGDDWTCKKMTGVPPVPGMSEFFQAARKQLRHLPPWTDEEFGWASDCSAREHDIHSLWSNVLPQQMERFREVGNLDELSDPSHA
jgi:hypothetical protein